MTSRDKNNLYIVGTDMILNNEKKWFKEDGEWGEQHAFQYDELLCEYATKFQDVKIYRTPEYGKMLVLDGFCQSAQKDEYIYHEALVHPALTMHPQPESVLIIGGGEGATAREVLRHPSIKQVIMVDIDGELVEFCKQHLPEWHQGAFDNPKVETIFADGLDYVETCRERFDCIILDVCDDLEDGPAHALYSREFYQKIKRLLTPSGILTIQAMEIIGLKPDLLKSDHLKVRRNLQGVFKHVAPYHTFVPSFWSEWGLIVASDSVNVGGYSPRLIDAILKHRMVYERLSFYDGLTHLKMFTLPRDMRTVIRDQIDNAVRAVAV